MADMSKYKKEFPSQVENRKQWVLDTVRANQNDVANLLVCAQAGTRLMALSILSGMHKQDRDALLLPNGILTNEQIEELT